jgi:hypothetical protein
LWCPLYARCGVHIVHGGGVLLIRGVVVISPCRSIQASGADPEARGNDVTGMRDDRALSTMSNLSFREPALSMESAPYRPVTAKWDCRALTKETARGHLRVLSSLCVPSRLPASASSSFVCLLVVLKRCALIVVVVILLVWATTPFC